MTTSSAAMRELFFLLMTPNPYAIHLEGRDPRDMIASTSQQLQQLADWIGPGITDSPAPEMERARHSLPSRGLRDRLCVPPAPGARGRPSHHPAVRSESVGEDLRQRRR